MNKYLKYKIKYLKFKNNQIGGQYLDNYQIIKPLGKGMHGTVFLVKNIVSGKEYAMKVEQVLEKDLESSSKSPVYREIEFANTMSSKYPQQFMTIYESENKECGYVHELSPEKWSSLDPRTKAYYEEIFASPWCSIKITNIVNDMLHNIIYKITDKKIIYDLFIQVVYIVYLINKEGYYHRDLHPKNIGVIHTEEEFIRIFDKDVPTHGYILQAIDYGMVIHSKYELDENERLQLEHDNDLYQNVYKIIFKIMLKNLIEKYPDIDINQIVPISEEDKDVINIIINKFGIGTNKYVYFEELLYKILFFDKFQEQIGICEKVKLFKFLSIENVKYIFENYDNLENILRYLIDNFPKEIIKITTQDEYEMYREEINRVNKICEPDDSDPIFDELYNIFFIMICLVSDTVLGFVKITDAVKYEDENYFEAIGGIKGSKGFMLSGVCANNKYNGIATPILKYVDSYAQENGYKYIFLHAIVDRLYLHQDTETGRKGLYIKNNYVNIGQVSKSLGWDNDFYIMRKEF